MCYRGVDFVLRELQRVRNEMNCFNVFNILGTMVGDRTFVRNKLTLRFVNDKIENTKLNYNLRRYITIKSEALIRENI